MIARDVAGLPTAVIETIDLIQRRFDEVDAAFAFEEGEDVQARFLGNRTL